MRPRSPMHRGWRSRGVGAVSAARHPAALAKTDAVAVGSEAGSDRLQPQIRRSGPDVRGMAAPIVSDGLRSILSRSSRPGRRSRRAAAGVGLRRARGDHRRPALGHPSGDAARRNGLRCDEAREQRADDAAPRRRAPSGRGGRTSAQATAARVRSAPPGSGAAPVSRRACAAALPPARQRLARQRRALPGDDRAGERHERDADQELNGQRRRIRAGPGGDVRQGGRRGCRQGGEGGGGALHRGPSSAFPGRGRPRREEEAAPGRGPPLLAGSRRPR